MKQNPQILNPPGGKSNLLKRIQEHLEARMRQKVTRAGALFTLVILAVAAAAFISANNLLILILAMMLATLLISGFVSHLGLAGLELDLTLPEHISARRAASARIWLRNAKFWMPSFSIHLIGKPPSAFKSALYFPVIPAARAISQMVNVEFQRRGAYREDGFEFWTRFPFGFTERRVQVTLRRDILVYPSLEPQPYFEALLWAVTGEIESNQRGIGSDFYRIRPYEPLESARHVDWKATAHTGELQVREFARDQDPLIEILLDLAVPDEHAGWFERAIDCCSFLVWNTAQRESRVRFRSRDFDLALPAEGDVYMVLKYLALVKRIAERTTPEEIPAPSDAVDCQVVFTTRPEALEKTGWSDALVVYPANFPQAHRGSAP